MTYGEVFQDKDIIKNYVNSSISFLSDFREYLKERAQLEKNYAKDSSSLIQKYVQKCDKKRAQSECNSPNTPNPLNTAESGTLNPENEESADSEINLPSNLGNEYYSYITAWKSILNQMEAISKYRLRFSENLTEIVIEKIKTQIGIKEDDKKRNLQYHKNFNDEVEKLVNEKNNAKKKYYESCDNMVNHKKKLNKQDSQANLEKSNDKGIKKIEKLIDTTQIEMDNKKNLYILSLCSLNTLKKKVANEYVPEIYNNLQSNQEGVIGAFQAYCKDYVKLEQDLSDNIKTSFDIALNDVNAIDPVNDNVIFETKNKKEIIPIEDEKYVSALNNDNDEFAITNKSSIYLSNLNDNLKEQLIAFQEKYNTAKSDYEQIQTAYQGYLNNPSATDTKDMKEKQSELWYNMHMAEIPIVINESKIETITKVIGEDNQVNSHNFKSVIIINPTVCDLCQEKVRGKALQCKSCSFVCHSKCEAEVPQRCTGTKMDRKALRVRTATSESNVSMPSSARVLSDTSEDNLYSSTPILSSSVDAITDEERYPINNMDEIKEEKPKIDSPMMCAIFEYQPQNGDEISLTVNENVEIIEPEVDGWVKVKTSNGEGFVPSSYIAPIKKVIYSFEPEKDDEIAITEGDSVVILGQDDSGWLKIKKGSLEGIVPESYIDM